ncbi:unnamed protein product [Cunninghamella blakesleeana]
MEKYSRWRDPGTGIQPFLPPVPPRTESSFLLTLTNIIHYVVGPLQGIIKFIFIILLGLLYLIFVPVFSVLLAPLGPLQRIWKKLFTAVFLRFILFFMGFFYIKAEAVTLRKGRNKSNGKKSLKVTSGDVIVTNWTSYVEVLYLGYRFNPVFTQIIPSKNKIRRITLWQAIRSCTKMPPITPEEANISNESSDLYTLKELSDIAKSKNWGPIILFPEATTSNGRALLKFASSIFNEFTPNDRDGRFHVMAFKYEYGYMPPSFTVGNQFFHLLSLCSQFSNTLRVKYLPDDETPCSVSGTVNANELSIISGSDDLVGGLFIQSLGNISRLRKTNMSINDKRDFLDYYYSLKSKKNTSKKNK